MFILASYVGAGLEIILMLCGIIGSIITYRKLKQSSVSSNQATENVSIDNSHTDKDIQSQD